MSIRTRFLVTAFCLGTALTLPIARDLSAQSASADRQFQAAIQKEEIDGDLKGAIAAYEGLAARKDLPRPLAASVLLRLAECYRKQGNQKADEVYARIVRDYKDQPTAYKAAMARVPAAPASREPRVRTVWGGPTVDLFGQVSPDGTILTGTDWITAGNLMVHDLRTGVDRALTTKKSWDDGPGEAGWSTVSRDGKHVAYQWAIGARQELRILPLDGATSPRTVFGSEDMAFLNPFDWSPDGQWIAAGVQRKDGTGQVVIIGTRDGAIRLLHSMDWKGPERIFFSRDGRFVAFDKAGGDDQVQRDIVVMAVDASRSVTAVQHAADDRLMGWSPDGAHLVFTSDRNGDVALWALPMADGAPAGSPTLLRPSTGRMFSLGITDAGSLVVHKGLSTRDVRLATVDLAAGRIGNARSFDRGFLGDTRAPSFSPDGRSLAYQACSGECIAVRSVSTGEVRRIPSFYSVDPRWSPDGTAFITAARDQRGRNGIFRVDASSGAASPIVLGPPFGAMPQWAPDGQSVYYRDRNRISRRHIAREHDDEIANLPGLGTFELSPDGRWIALKTRDNAAGTSKLLLMPAEGGTPVEWLRAGKGEEFGGLRQLVWTPDSAGILVTKRTQAGFEVWHLPRQGQPRELQVDVEGWPVQRPAAFANAFSLSPDGRTVAFLVGTASQEVWSLDNMLPTSTRGTQAKR